MSADTPQQKSLQPTAETVIELVIRTDDNRRAEWIIAQVRRLLEDGTGDLDAVATFPATVYDAEQVPA